jgi:hypothetical protein
MVGSFAQLVSWLSDTLKPARMFRNALKADETYEFNLDTTLNATNTCRESLQVSLLLGPSGDVPWPAIFVAVDGEDVALTAGGVVGDRSQRYSYPRSVPAFAPLTHRFVFPGSGVVPPKNPKPPLGRDAVRWQHGQTRVSVLRNAVLVADTPTNPSFIYQTPWIGFANPVVPLLRSTARIAVGTGPGIAAGLASALGQVLGDDQTVKYLFRVLCRYDRLLVTADGGTDAEALVAPLPVFYVPLAAKLLADLPTFVAQAASQAANWLLAEGIEAAADDAYVFDIAVYTNDGSQMTRPLIEFSELTIPIA